MTKAYRLRLVLLVLSIAVVAFTAIWVVQQSSARIDSLERRLTAGQLESFRLASEFQSRLQMLNNTVLRITARRDPAALTEFEHASAALDRWVDQYDPRLNPRSPCTTELERRILPEINSAFDRYSAAARNVLTNQQPPAMTAAAYAQLTQVEQESRHLFALGTQLANAHRQAQESFLAAANRELRTLRVFVMSSIMVMLLLIGVLGALIYRDLVRPLRVRLVQSQTLLERQEKLATLGTLAAGIAHEIRNPLTSIKARLYTLDKHIRDNPPGRRDARVIGEEIGRLERIVQDVLDFARPSEPQRQIMPADAPLREVHSLMAGSLQQTNIQLRLEVTTPPFVSIDLALMKQVLINLVRNAAEASPAGGAVTLRARASRAGLHGAEVPVAVLEVEDAGQGIPPEVEPRLFDPFFTTKESGTGLGLSIAARIVEKHGGMIQYQTRTGRGTTFGIVLPASPAPTDHGASDQKT